MACMYVCLHGHTYSTISVHFWCNVEMPFEADG